MKKEMRVLGIDDAPFDKSIKKDILLVGAFFRGGTQLDGILSTKIRVDGNNATRKIAAMIMRSKFRPQLQCTILNGIAVGGFNVIDIHRLFALTRIPVLVVVRRKPDFARIRSALTVAKKSGSYRLIEKAGPPRRLGKIYVQFAGIDLAVAKDILAITSTKSDIPEPLRVAHLIAGGIADGESRGRA